MLPAYPYSVGRTLWSRRAIYHIVVGVPLDRVPSLCGVKPICWDDPVNTAEPAQYATCKTCLKIYQSSI